MKRLSKENLMHDCVEMLAKSIHEGYLFNHTDAFALGYLAGKYKLTTLKKTPKRDKAIKDYDKTDDLGLCDTIEETFIDLSV